MKLRNVQPVPRSIAWPIFNCSRVVGSNSFCLSFAITYIASVNGGDTFPSVEKINFLMSTLKKINLVKSLHTLLKSRTHRVKSFQVLVDSPLHFLRGFTKYAISSRICSKTGDLRYAI